jgi:type IV pilus assembly protein PilM
MLDFLTLKPQAFGLDIAASSLKIAKLQKKGRFFDLASVGYGKIEPGIIEEGELKLEDRFTEILKKALSDVRGQKLKTKYVVASLPDEKAFLQVIQMPKLNEEELQKAVCLEAENYIPLPLEQVCLDCQVVQPLSDHLDHCDVLIAALPKNIIGSYVNCLKKAGLQPLAIEIEPLALARALIKDEKSTTPLLIIDFGATETSLIIFSGFNVCFNSSLPVSSQSITENIAKALKIGFVEAEKLKLKYGLVRNDGPEASEVFEATVPVLIDLIEQIQKYIDYYCSHRSHEHLPPNGQVPHKALLCGGGANLKGFLSFLSKELKFPIELADPWVNICPAPKRNRVILSPEESLVFSPALGAALRGARL